ncbi:MAG: TonB-dependent receptor plug domain-containing protein, partial [Bacteroidetes bacterium]|nr:TonB-dependent receptor plug domain-containing protein [Bacteroidota bacterium]
YLSQELEVLQDSMYFAVPMQAVPSLGQEIVVAASRIEERILEAPVSIEKMGLVDIRQNPSPDFYTGVAYLKGVNLYQSSLMYNSINTRGFANVQNWRFVRFIDGMDINGPSINYAIGSTLRGSELDIQSIEVVPGPGSALYGANAFNGILNMTSKNPFEYQGLSAYAKQGVSKQRGEIAHPFTDIGIRYARSFNEKWAFKVNLTFLDAMDWVADDEGYLITNQTIHQKDQLLQTLRNDPNYNAVNIYGDDIAVPVSLGDGQQIVVNRTGFAEKDLVDYKVNTFHIQSSVHYRPTKNMEAIYDFRFAQSDAIIRYENFYPFANFQTHYHKLELKGSNFFVRSYFAQGSPGDGYSVLAAGAIIQEGLKPGNLWGEDYGAAMRGEVPGINAGDHDAARLFADRDIPGADSDIFQQLRSQTISTPIDQPGGSGVVYKSNLWHTEGNYNFQKEIPFMELQAGGALRRYLLSSDGHVYNDGIRGFNAPIPVTELGAYVQAGKKLFDEHLNLRGSIRYDQQFKNFKGRFTPRLSSVLSLGKTRQHNFRLSAQTGFRNPANQDTYVAFNAGPLIYLGNIEDNINNYTYVNANGEEFTGKEIHSQLVTIPSLQAFMQAGGTDPSLLELANIEYLQQEQITTFELGYKGLIQNRLMVDANIYHNIYQNFTANILSYSLQANIPFLTLSNIDGEVTSTGAGLGLTYLSRKGYKLEGNYSYIVYDAEEAIAQNPNYFPDFNTPRNSFHLMASNKNVYQGLGFSAKFRWTEGYTFQSPNGQGEIDPFQVLDIAILYEAKPLKSIIKLGAANLFNNNYKPVYGGPRIGAQYYMGITFDNFLQ